MKNLEKQDLYLKKQKLCLWIMYFLFAIQIGSVIYSIFIEIDSLLVYIPMVLILILNAFIQWYSIKIDSL